MAKQITSQLSLIDTIIEGKIGKRQQQVLDMFTGSSKIISTLAREILFVQKNTANNNQIAMFLGLPINVVTARVFELRKLGKLVEAKKERDPATNRLVIYWRLV